MKKMSQSAHRGSRGLDRRRFLATAGTALAAGLLPGRTFAQEPAQKPVPPAARPASWARAG